MPCAAPTNAKYNSDGTGRDTYIRRDPVECFGKAMYKSEARLVTRFGAAGSVVAREKGCPVGETDPVGGHNGGIQWEKPARYLRTASQAYPVAVSQYTTMKEITQDAFVSSQQHPGAARGVSGYTGFKPRYPTGEWAQLSHLSAAQ